MTQHHSSDFFELIRSIGETKSKQEEDKIIVKEVSKLKPLIVQKNIKPHLMKEYIIRALYCEMLGHSSSYSYIHAINLTSSTDIFFKQVGYLAVTLCIPNSSEFMLLLIAVIQRDLKSTNYLEVSAALTAASKVITIETLPALMSQIISLKTHNHALVRKKVAMLLCNFYKLNPDCYDLLGVGKELLCDRDPSVMAASLNFFTVMAQDPKARSELKKFVPTFVDILGQVIDYRLPVQYDYHKIPAPFIQMKLLKLFGQIGKNDKETSAKMYAVITQVIQKADTGANIGNAIIYESVQAVTSIYPNNNLMETAAAGVSRFITNKSQNLLFLGIQCLKNIVKINAKYAAQHQQAVINCLEHKDESIKRVTLDLLYAMTNPDNCEVIVKKLLKVAQKSVIDSHLKEELIKRISFLAENYAPNAQWYVETMNKLFDIGPEFIPMGYVQNMLNIVAEGSSDGDEDEAIRIYCVESYVNMLETKDNINDKLMLVIAWIIGEYGYLSKKYKPEDLIEILCEADDRKLIEETRIWLLPAVMKLCAQIGEVPLPAQELARKFINSKNVDIQQRAYEYLLLKENVDILDSVFPQDGAAEEIEIDVELSFLNDYVKEQLKSGAREYLPEGKRIDIINKGIKDNISALRTEQYNKPEVVKSRNLIEGGFSQTEEFDISKTQLYPENYQDSSLSVSNVRRVWYEDDEEEEKQEQQTQSKPSEYGTYKYETKTNSMQSMFSVDSSMENSSPFQKSTSPTPEAKISKENEELVSGLFGGSKSERKRKKATKTKKPMVVRHTEMSPAIEPEVKSEPEVVESKNLLEDISFEDIKPQKVNTVQVSEPKKPELSLLDDFFTTPQPKTEQIVKDEKKQNILDSMTLLQPVDHSKMEKQKPLVVNTLTQDNILTKDQFIVISSQKVQQEDGIDLNITFSTTSGFTLTSIYAQFQPPEKFNLKFETADKNALVRGSSITFSQLEPGTPIKLTVKLQLSELNFGFQFMGSVTYSNQQQSRQFLSLSTKIDMKDLFRPLQMTTQEYAKLWKSNTNEKKIQFHTEPSMYELQAIIQNQFNAHVVSVIGSEIISVAKVCGLDSICLMHFKKSKTLGLTVRSESSSLSEKVIIYSKQVFTGNF